MIMSGLENPTSGKIIFKNIDFSKISEKKKTEIRKKNWVNLSTILSNPKLYGSRECYVSNANKRD